MIWFADIQTVTAADLSRVLAKFVVPLFSVICIYVHI
jgi:hypothetical protein